MALLASTASFAACGGPGQYVWFSELPAQARAAGDDDDAYVIADGDTVNVRVLGHEEMNVREKVRPDGRIALPLIGEVDARGKRPGSLRAELEGRLKDYILTPSVMVNVDETQPMTIVLLGEVQRPGAYTLPSAGLAQAIALGGGLTEYASRNSIFVVRQRPQPARIRFAYDWISRNIGRAAAFPLHDGDLVVVE